jgi:5-methylcytosine-specific restriction endonuclease McrA
MICADFLAGANLDSGEPDVLLSAISRFIRIPSGRAEAGIRRSCHAAGSMNQNLIRHMSVRLDDREYQELREQVLRRDGWRCQFCGSITNLEVHHQQFRSHSGSDQEENLITLCSGCHSSLHRRLRFSQKARRVRESSATTPK